MSISSTGVDRHRTQVNLLLLGAAAAGAAVSVSLAVYARVHEPSREGITSFGFPTVLSMKAWFGTAAALLVLVQIVSALGMWGRLPGVPRAPRWLAPVHRWSGTAAFVVSLPVAYHCLAALGFQATNARVVVHSLFGTAFYGAFTTKMLALRIRSLPGWALPLIGGLVATSLVLVWWTSSIWYFRNFGFPGV